MKRRAAGPAQHRVLSTGVAAALLASVALAASGCGSDEQGVWEPVGTASDGVTICADGPVIQGIDVSHWQGAIDWTQAYGDGIDFAIAKATEADGFVDDTFATNRQNAKAAGVVFGAYHFFRADVDGVAQAEHFLSVLGSVEPGEITPVLDLETTDGQSAATINQRALAFMAAVESATGRIPMIYTSPSFYSSTLGAPGSFGDYLLWIANWEVSCPDVPSTWDDWTVWQTADDGSVAGISGAVDLDEFDGTIDELQCVGVPCATGTCVAGTCDDGAVGGNGGGDQGGSGAGIEGGAGGAGAEEPEGGGYRLEVVAGIPGENSGCTCGTEPATGTGSPGVWVVAGLGGLGLFRRRRNPFQTDRGRHPG